MANIGSLTYNVIAARRRAIRNEPTPWYEVGNIINAIGMGLLFAGMLLDVDTPAGTTLAVLAALLIVWSTITSTIAYRNRTP